MSKIETQSFTRGSIIVVVLAVFFSSFTLWLIESWIKYPFFLLEVLTIIILYLLISDCDIKTTLKQNWKGKIDISLTFELLLIAFSSVLLMLAIFLIDGGLVQLTLSLLCTSFLSGFAILNIFGLARHFSRLENLVLSFILSFAFTGFITFISLAINQDVRTIVVLSSFILVGSISAFKHKRSGYHSAFTSFSKNIDLLVLLLAVTFFVISFCVIYPGFAFLPGIDISEHYVRSIVLGRTPDLYIGSTYVFSHLHESTFLTLSNTSLASAQTALVTLNLILPLAFYVMAKQYLEKIDKRLPSLATIFWIFFTNSFGGFAWFYFAFLKVSSTGQTQLQLLTTTADKTYNGTVYGILGLWYIPGVVSLVILMTTILLMRKKDIPTSRYIGLFAALVAVSYLTHVTAAVIFALFLAGYGVIARNQNFRTDDAIKASILGFLFVIIAYYFLSTLTTRFLFDTSLLLSIIGPISALFLSLLIRKMSQRKFSFKIKSIMTNKTFLKTVFLSVLFVYVITFLSWGILAASFHTWQVDTIGLIPWFMYPLILGVNGLLAIIALYQLATNSKVYTILAFFIAFMIFAFIFGRLVSTVNLYFFDAGYWEKRFIWFIRIPLAALAPIPILLLVDRLKRRKIHFRIQTVASVIIIGTIVLYGISSTFLNVEYWNIKANDPANLPSSEEMSAIDALKGILDKDPKAWVATVTDASAGMTTLAAPADQLVLKELLYTAYTPEMAFAQLYRLPEYSHPYIYIHNRDMTYLDKYNDRFLTKFLSTLSIVFNNSEVKIYNTSKPSFPQSKSENVLIIPQAQSMDEKTRYMTYSALSKGFYNYTVAYDLDDNALNAKTITLSFDPPVGNNMSDLFEEEFNQTLDSWNIYKGSWQIENGKLLGGESGKRDEGILLSSLSAENFTSTFRVKPMGGDIDVANYARFVYAWTDAKNYRIADILFNSDNFIYVLFRNVGNGVEEELPRWPGVKTNLGWDFGTEYTITVSASGTLNEISINGKNFLSLNSENVNGRIGLGYFRFYGLEFDDFSVNYTSPINLRSTQDYLDYLHSGGRIILLNTNGYGYFADDLFSVSTSTVSAQTIEGQNLKLDLPSRISTPHLQARDENTTTVAYYRVSSNETPFILHKNYGKGELLYLNVRPIIEELNGDNNKSAFYELFGELLKNLELPKLDPEANLLSTIQGYVKAIRLTNDVEVQTQSLIFPLNLKLTQMSAEMNSELRTFYDVDSVTITNCSGVTLESGSVTLESGSGLYADVNVNSAFTVKPLAGSLSLKVVSGDETFSLNDVKQLSVPTNVTVQLIAKTPNVSALQVNFVEFYTQGSLQWSTRTYGQNLKVTGPTQFSVALSDSYTAITNVKLGSTFQRDPPIVTFDELSTISTAIFWSLLLLPLFLCVILILTMRKIRIKLK